MSRYDRLALLLSLAAVLAAWLVAHFVFDELPHLEDEFAFTWQAKVFAQGKLAIDSPQYPTSFLVPFVVDYNGLRFGKYPPGWPSVLAIGVLLGIRSWINPLLAGAGIWLIYQLGKKVSDELTGLLAAGLTLTSPFFLMNSGSLLSHPLGLVLSTVFVINWLESFNPKINTHPWSRIILSAVSLGWLALTRPLTALAVSLPFGIHGLYLLWRGDKHTRLRLMVFCAVTLIIAGIFPLWQFAVTGDPWLNPYTLWWPYDKVGFGVGYGVTEEGHNLQQAIWNTEASVMVGAGDLFGWGPLSYLLLPFGLWALRRNGKAWLVASIPISLLVFYLAYWIGSYLFGPRYYYESLPSLALLTAAGSAWLAGWHIREEKENKKGIFTHLAKFSQKIAWKKNRRLAVTALLAMLVFINFFLYLPYRLGMMHNLYGIQAEDQALFKDPATLKLAPALVFVYADHWMEYGALIDMEDPWLTSPIIFAWNIGPARDAEVAALYPERNVFHYYPDEPGKLYLAPRDSP
jgi:4-amino-4-deoxy-L-arabinose transferase-like glycosyltransferase